MQISKVGLCGRTASSLPGPDASYDFTGSSPAVPGGFTFVRASSAYYINSAGLLVSVSSNTARFEYHPGTLQARGLLVEEARTNLLLYSEALDNAAWTKAACTIAADAATAPDGNATADKIVESATTAEHILQRSVTITSGDTVTVSTFVKSAGRTVCYFLLDAGAPFATASFDLAAKTATLNFRAQSGTAVVASAASIDSYPNGWSRIQATFTTTGVTSVTYSLRLCNGAAYTYAGDGSSGVYAWGHMLEKGNAASSYIATTSAAVTRAADICTAATSGLSWFNANQGTMLMETDVPGTPVGNPRLWQADDNSGNNRVWNALSASNTILLRATVSGSLTGDIASAVRGSVTRQTAVTRYIQDGYMQSVPELGRDLLSDSSSNVPTLNTLRIGCGDSNISQLNGYIRRLKYWGKALTDGQIRSMR